MPADLAAAAVFQALTEALFLLTGCARVFSLST